jgi:phosphatidylglycerol:prolipoprotein diacylglycerol transferase
MFPYIVFLGRSIGTYQVMALLGIFSAGIYSCIYSKTGNVDYVETLVLLLVACIGIILGGHVLYIIVNIKHIGTKHLFVDLVRLFFNGSIFYGGLIGSIGITYIFRKRFIHYKQIIEIVTPAIPLFHFFGRIGCFLNGCCFGVKNSIGFMFKSSPIGIANGITRFPVQLIESVFNLILFIVLHGLRAKKPFKNYLFQFYLLLYSTGRFILEFYRGDIYRGVYFYLSTSQIISIIIFVIAISSITVKNIYIRLNEIHVFVVFKR